MAWQFVGVSNAVTVTSGNITLVETGITGLQANDLLVACISYRSNAAFTKPSGWSDVTSQNTGNTTAATTGSIGSGFMAYIVRGSSAPSLTFTRTAGDVALGRIVAYRDVDVASPLVTQTSTTLAAAATAVSVGGVTTSNDRDLIVFALCGARNGTATNFDAATNPTTASGTNSGQTAAPIAGTWQERADSGTTSGADCGLAIADAIRDTAGATGNLTCTASVSARHVVLAAVFKENIPIAMTASNLNLSSFTLGSPALTLENIVAMTANSLDLGTVALEAPQSLLTPVEDYNITLRITRI